jgi:hypothetical protein
MPLEEFILRICEIIVIPLLTAIGGFLSGRAIQRLKNRPVPIVNKCRISDLEVYTHYDSDNKPCGPDCPFLMSEGKCRLLINDPNDPILQMGGGDEIMRKRQVFVFRGGSCYLYHKK